MNRKTLPLLITVCLGWSGFNAVAAESAFEQFYQQHNSAYASYRAALFQTNKNDQTASLKGINGFNVKWNQLVTQFAGHPPEIFAADEEWGATLTKISEIAAQSTEQIKSGELSHAHETLEAIREQLADLRSRNHLVFFSDYVNRFHAVMEQLLQAGYGEENINNQAKLTIRERLAVLDFLAQDIKVNAPQDYQSDKTFNKLLEGLMDSLATLRSSLDGNDPQAISKAISSLKPAYAKLFARFG